MTVDVMSRVAVAELRELPEPLVRQACGYLTDVLRDITQPLPPAPAAGAQVQLVPLAQVLDLLGGRRFTHLSRTQAQPHLARMQPVLQADMDAGRPLRFCYDLGPGYHASVRADFAGLRFAPGLGELLALRQIRVFAQAVSVVYPPGVRFELVIDDLCAWMANDVATELTAGYCTQLQALVARVGMQELVGVLAESAVLGQSTYRQAFEALPCATAMPLLTPAERDNVSRFVGRACDDDDARDHLERYQRALRVSERLLAPYLGGVRLTQRATASSLGFRAFAGGDARLQSGEVDVVLGEGGSPRPGLITSRNGWLYRRWPLAADCLPAQWPLPPGAVCAAVCRPDGTPGGCTSSAQPGFRTL
jgi:hypothetical protein